MTARLAWVASDRRHAPAVLVRPRAPRFIAHISGVIHGSGDHGSDRGSPTGFSPNGRSNGAQEGPRN